MIARGAGSFFADEDGGVGRVVLLGLIGALLGVPVGALIASLLWEAICSGGAPGSHGERCGLEGLLFFLIGAPAGGVIGAVIGAIVGSRLSRSQDTSPSPKTSE